MQKGLVLVEEIEVVIERISELLEQRKYHDLKEILNERYGSTVSICRI